MGWIVNLLSCLLDPIAWLVFGFFGDDSDWKTTRWNDSPWHVAVSVLIVLAITLLALAGLAGLLIVLGRIFR